MFVPDGFEPPRGLETSEFRLEPLGPVHNERDFAAWSSSIEHIRASPGYGVEERVRGRARAIGAVWSRPGRGNADEVTRVRTASAGRTTLVALPRMASPSYAMPGSFMGSVPAVLF